MPWPIVSGLLDRVNLIEYRRHAHTALLAYIMAASMGGVKDADMSHYLLGFAQVGESRKAGELRLTLKGKQAESFRLGLKLGLVSQRMLNHFVDG